MLLYEKVSGNFEHLQYFNLETNFLENENLFKKIVVPLLFENTQTENALFLNKTAISEAIVQTNRMTSAK